MVAFKLSCAYDSIFSGQGGGGFPGYLLFEALHFDRSFSPLENIKQDREYGIMIIRYVYMSFKITKQTVQ